MEIYMVSKAQIQCLYQRFSDKPLALQQRKSITQQQTTFYDTAQIKAYSTAYFRERDSLSLTGLE